MSTAGSLSKEMMDLVKAIGEARSKQEEDKIIETEAQKLKEKFKEKSITEKKMKDLLIRTVYVEMLGHDGGFAHIHAINMTQKKNILSKRIGYLASTLFLDKDNELLILLVATLQRDLESESYLEVLSSLQVISRLANAQIMTATYDQVIKLLAHPSDFVRKKAIMVLHRFSQINPGGVPDIDLRMKSALCDKVPSVMAASLNYFVEAWRKDPEKYKELASSFGMVLKQVIEHKLPREYDYHRMPAPWIQMRLLEILGYLGKDDKETSKEIYEVVQMTLKRAEDLAINIGHALVYQCIKTILTIYPNEALMENISKSIKAFFSSESNNLKYIGVNWLNSMLKIDLKYAEDHQENVVEWLECSDDTLKLKTLDLLYTMTNKDNVEAIIEKMLEHLKSAPSDSKIRRDLVKKIYQSVEKYSPNKTWFVKTINKLFEMGADLITLDISNKFITVIWEHEAESEGKKFRESIIKIYKSILKKSPHIFDSHMQVIVYILGEYVPRTKDSDKAEEIINLLCESWDRQFEKT